MTSNRNILLTGGTGFLGSALLRAFVSIIIDMKFKFTTNNKKNY